MDDDRAALAAQLAGSLDLALPPIAVGFADELPIGMPKWTTRVPAGCRFWQEAARGVFATSPADHDLCAIGTFTHNLEGTPEHESERRSALRVFSDLGYVRDDDVPTIPVLARRSRHVIYGPLADVPIDPAVTLLFARADQLLVLSEAAQQAEGGVPPALGRPACAIVPQAVNSGRTAMSLGCCGARAYLDVFGPEIAIFAVPMPRLAAFAERVGVLARANVVLAKFHRQRRRDVEAGASPTITQSLAAMHP